MSDFKGIVMEGGDFDKAEDIAVGDPAGVHGETFVEVTRDGDEITFVTSDGNTFTKEPDDIVFCPRESTK